jgi:hypothetical protein
MMSKEEILSAWAPEGGDWSLWARPVLFAQMSDDLIRAAGNLAVDEIRSLPVPEFDRETAVVVDLPGRKSVRTGLALALEGYRPVPMYNGCTGPHEAVDQSGIMSDLAAGAGLLAGLKLEGAPPALLIDSLRTTSRSLRPGDFDNRWRVYFQDFPAIEEWKGRGIRRVVLVRGNNQPPGYDLADVLVRWQESEINVELFDVGKPGKSTPFVAKRPWRLWSPFRPLLEAFGFHRGPRRGFGRIVPEPRHG